MDHIEIVKNLVFGFEHALSLHNLLFCAIGCVVGMLVGLLPGLGPLATISLLQQRSAHRSTVLNEQLQTALNSRVLIEQAKGKLAERRRIDMEQAFTALRDYARSHNRRLADLARAFIEGAEPLPGLNT